MSQEAELAAARELVRLAGKYIRSHRLTNLDDWRRLLDHELAARPGDPAPIDPRRREVEPPEPVLARLERLSREGHLVVIPTDPEPDGTASIADVRRSLRHA